ncbi:enoyl-CoA hydratase [Hahella sp. CCB-MM4]|uniref:enoyl-CoA hydratase/isomerase family protein n=1 Tax=Hahella sp. (strain CCB-MM4) TaxID=1926491 RepID=UPI000B9C11B7|nr:enoyl-CoA hydratase/isomerase family protein [Hahella sp. CCB-MM4]OZG69783.1 enoyl-CoA hydratase [Hahella sp. CCB-MM4]
MSAVLFNDYPTRDGKKIVEIKINAERTLNALTLEMIDLIQAKLDEARHDDSIVAFLLDSEGDKAFCAGGDIVNLYKSMTGEGPESFIQDFFTREYVLDHCIHTYSKPIICWGSGIVMGGGIGLMNGCSHRIVSESSHLAMPEIAIGLIPDVAGSWFLQRMPGRTGLFLGLTGNPINADDALFLGLADRFIAKELKSNMIERLQNQDWSEGPAVVDRVLRELETLSGPQRPMDSPIRTYYDEIQELTDADSLPELVQKVIDFRTEDPWMMKAQKTLKRGSPLAMHLCYRQWHESKHRSLKEVFESELILSVNISHGGDLQEGVRALLVDKDGKPEWMRKSVSEVKEEDVAKFFLPFWDQQRDRNPLMKLWS